MIIDKSKILKDRREIIESDSDGSGKIDALHIALDAGCEWAESLPISGIRAENRRRLRKDCAFYIADNASFGEKPSGFIGGLLWSWFISTLISWIAKKIIDQLLGK